MSNENKKINIELLAPAGSLGSLIAAVRAGADAIYIGGSKFGARAYADNPNEDELIKGISYAHHFGVKVYLTVNTLFKNREIYELYNYLLPYYKAGLDAVIVQDIGVFSFVRKHFPELNIHASTQMTVTGKLSTRWLYENGATRVVPARELSLFEIEEIHKSCDIEVECFVHGALCYSYSGQCLMSSLIGGRSGNRGRCAQPCRLEYSLYDNNDKKLNSKKECTLLSCKDLCSLDLLPDIYDAGVYSLKIEGRMKSAIYTAGVVSIWRKYIELYKKYGMSGYKVEKKDREKLLELFDRGGQTDGYYKKHNGADMMAFEKKPELRITDGELISGIKDRYIDSKDNIAIEGYAVIKKDMPISLKISADIVKDRVSGDVEHIEVIESLDAVEEAKSRAALKDDILKQLTKTGDSLYSFSSLEIELDDGLFIPVSRLNELRRKAIEKLDAAIAGMYERACDARNDLANHNNNLLEQSNEGCGSQDVSGEIVGRKNEASKNIKLNVVCSDYDQLQAALDLDEVDEIGIELSLEADKKEFTDAAQKAKSANKKLYIYMPHIFRKNILDEFEKKLELLNKIGISGYIARNTEELFFIKKRAGLDIIADYSLYTMNNIARSEVAGLGAARLTLPVELNIYELSELTKNDNYNNELIVYGRLPMMVSAQCLKKNVLGCDKKKEILWLKDRKGELMPVYNNCDYCYNTIFNAKPLSLIGMSEEIFKKINPNAVRVYLTTENKSQSKEIIKAAAKAFKQRIKIEDPIADFTRGHIKRGVE